MRPSPRRRLSCLLLILLLSAFSAKAQTAFTRIYGPLDRDVAAPDPVLTTGETAAPALQEVAEHLSAVGGGEWKDMTGTGQITYAGDSQASPATLTLMGADRYRLDSGAGSLLVNGLYSAFQDSAGKKSFPGPEFARQGLNVFALLRMSGFPNANTALLEKGVQTVGGVSLHRISVVQVAPRGATYGVPFADKTPANFIVTDLYFDPASHLLLKSAGKIRLAGSGNEEFLECVTYDDYRSVDGVQVPFRYAETLNGQLQWTLQLDAVTLDSGVQSSSFNFK